MIKTSHEPFLGTIGLKIVTDNPESVVEVVNSVTGDDIAQLLTEQANLHHSQNAQKWTVSPKTLKWSHIRPEEMTKVFETNNFDGTSQRGKYKRLLVH